MEKVEYTMSVPKETKEVVDALAGLVDNFVNGGGLAGASAHIPAVMNAVDGFAKVGDELKSELNDEAAAYLIHKLWGSLKKSPAVVPAVTDA